MADNARESGNFCCVFNCLSENDVHLLPRMFAELLGREVDPGECASGSRLTWHVSNKYYSTDIEFVVHKTVQETCDSGRDYEGFVLMCNLSQVDILEDVSKKWEELDKQLSPNVCLVVGAFDSRSKEALANQKELLQWCVENAFELVEWDETTPNGAEQEDTDYDDGLPPDPVGISRVSDALQAHMWPNMDMQGKGSERGKSSESTREQEGTPATTAVVAIGEAVEKGESKKCELVPKEGLDDLETKVAASLSDSKEEVKRKVDSMLSEDERLIAEGLGDDKDPGGESFENLFARFAQMKHHAESLPHEERKQYAEKVVMAFWNAIGGDEDEVKISDDETNK